MGEPLGLCCGSFISPPERCSGFSGRAGEGSCVGWSKAKAGQGPRALESPSHKGPEQSWDLEPIWDPLSGQKLLETLPGAREGLDV